MLFLTLKHVNSSKSQHPKVLRRTENDNNMRPLQACSTVIWKHHPLCSGLIWNCYWYVCSFLLVGVRHTLLQSLLHHRAVHHQRLLQLVCFHWNLLVFSCTGWWQQIWNQLQHVSIVGTAGLSPAPDSIEDQVQREVQIQLLAGNFWVFWRVPRQDVTAAGENSVDNDEDNGTAGLHKDLHRQETKINNIKWVDTKCFEERSVWSFPAYMEQIWTTKHLQSAPYLEASGCLLPPEGQKDREESDYTSYFNSLK